MHDLNGWGLLGKVDTSIPLCGPVWSHEPYGTQVMWVQEYPTAGCKNISKCCALYHEHVIVSSALVVEFSIMDCG